MSANHLFRFIIEVLDSGKLDAAAMLASNVLYSLPNPIFQLNAAAELVVA